MTHLKQTQGVPRRNALLALLALLAMTASGCTSPARFTPATGSEKYPPYEGQVRVLENLPPSGQYTRVGVVIVEGVQLTKDSDMVAAVKREAARNGADAVVMQGPIKSMRDASGGVQRTLAAWAIRLNR
jgi:hypothetical protein